MDSEATPDREKAGTGGKRSSATHHRGQVNAAHRAGRSAIHPHTATLPFMKYLLLVFALCFAGCAKHQFAQPDGKWTTRTGQLLYRESDRSIIGELALSTSGQHAKLEFTKGPGLSLMRVERDATHARFEGPLARLPHTISLSGKPSGRDAGWLEITDRAAKESRFNVAAGGAQFSVQLAPAR
jgi:hypothetical protein